MVGVVGDVKPFNAKAQSSIDLDGTGVRVLRLADDYSEIRTLGLLYYTFHQAFADAPMTICFNDVKFPHPNTAIPVMWLCKFKTYEQVAVVCPE